MNKAVGQTFHKKLFLQLDSSFLENLKMTLLRSCMEILTYLTIFLFIAFSHAKILLLLLRNNKLGVKFFRYDLDFL